MADTNEPIPSEERDKTGRFVAGNKGGPGGRRRMSETASRMLDDAEVIAVKALVDGCVAFKSMMVDGMLELTDIPDHSIRIDSASKLLDRKWGKPVQMITGEDGGPVQIGGSDELIAAINKLAGK